MKDQISFMSGLFDTAAPTTAASGSRHLGEDLAKWMISKSEDSEFVFGEPVETQTGWTERVTANGETFAVGFDLADGSVGSDYAEWFVTIEKPRSVRVFGSKDSSTRGRLCDHIHNVLRDERQVRELQWL